MFCRPIQLGIKEISKEDYLSACDEGLELLYAATCDGVTPVAVTPEDLLMVAMCKPGGSEPVVSYVKLRHEYIFTMGAPWMVTPLRPYAN